MDLPLSQDLVQQAIVFQSKSNLLFEDFVLIFWLMSLVTTLALGSRPRQGLTRMRAKKEARESNFMLLRVQKSVRE